MSRSILVTSAVLGLQACTLLPFFGGEPRDKPCGAAEGSAGTPLVCPEGYPWCSCATQRCAKTDAADCATGFVHIDGTCLSFEEATALKPSLPFDHPTCLAVCSEARGCDDGNICNGGERCLAGFCLEGESLPDDTECGMNDAGQGVCRGGRCAPMTCGDGAVNPPYEECDDGNAASGDGCEGDCAWTCKEAADCGDNDPCDGYETCDVTGHRCLEGDPPPNDTKCSKDGIVGRCVAHHCIPEKCGNGAVDELEECDDGNLSDNDACLITCRLNTCGDGHVRAGVEECDDGNRLDGDGCESDCRWTCIRDEQCRMAGICKGCTPGHACGGLPVPDGEECDLDGNLSTLEACFEGSCMSM